MAMAIPPELDSKDNAILQILIKDSRTSIRTIAKETGIRPSTVHQRIKKLVTLGAIKQFTVKLDDEIVGEPLTVFILIAGAPGKYLDEKLFKLPAVKEVHGITGEYDIIMKCKFKDLNEFHKFLIEFRDKYGKSISKTITMVETMKLKE
ncbi:MAG: Lrp/AsnC family transcriptional regulator [Thermoplasmata archaeon]|nr:MAG: Lrp/AsnC family transcriptional regulator [Thermoplasmata archaeon]